MGKIVHLEYSASLSRLCEINSSFDSGLLTICYTGENRNKSFFDRETIERCMPTIYNCPVVCHYMREDDSIGGHDSEVVSDENGIRIVNVTNPIGVVPESAKPYFEVKEDENGVRHEYLCVEVLIWKRQEAYEKIKRDGISGQSMEVSVKDGFLDKNTGLFVIKDFEFNAFCILGQDVTPCFEGASLQMYSMGEMKDQMEQMMSDLKQTLETFTIQNIFGCDNNPQKNDTEGGKILEDKISLLNEYGLNIDDLDFSIEDFSIDELKEKFEEMKKSQDECNDNGEPAAEVNDGANFELEGNFRENLLEAISVEKAETCFGEMDRYWFVDYDPAVSEVYVMDSNDWKLYGFAYSMDGDNVVIDYGCKTRKKYAIVDYVDGDNDINTQFESVFQLASQKYSENDNAWKQKCDEADGKIAKMQDDISELADLRKYKEDFVNAQLDALFSSFKDLDGVEAFDNLKSNHDGMDVVDIEEKCYAIRGRNSSVAQFSFSGYQVPVIPVSHDGTKVLSRPYGDLFEKYDKE